MLIVLGATVLMPTCTFLGTRLYSLHFKVEEVSALLIFRIASSVLLAIGTLGMPIALQRSIAFHYQSARFKADLAMAGSILATVGLAAVAAICILFAPSIAGRMGHPEAAGLWSAMSVVTVGCGLVTTLTCIDLSRGRTRVSAITNAFGYGIAFLLPVAIIRGTSITTLAWITAACTFAACVPAAVNIARWWLETRRLNVEQEKPHAFRSLLGYGVPRIFANLLDPAFDLLLPWAALYVSGLSSAGYFAAGLALLRPLNPVMSAINMILIPASARLAAEEARDRQKARTTIVAQAALHLGLLAALLLATWGDAVMRLWLGDSFAEAGRYIRVLALSVCPLLLYQCARGNIDGENERA
jgi:O-antigen/teichoic acid export membrane protein